MKPKAKDSLRDLEDTKELWKEALKEPLELPRDVRLRRLWETLEGSKTHQRT
jgi:hypothetical protein